MSLVLQPRRFLALIALVLIVVCLALAATPQQSPAPKRVLPWKVVTFIADERGAASLETALNDGTGWTLASLHMPQQGGGMAFAVLRQQLGN